MKIESVLSLSNHFQDPQTSSSAIYIRNRGIYPLFGAPVFTNPAVTSRSENLHRNAEAL